VRLVEENLSAGRGELATLLENRVHELSAPLHRGAERKRA